LSKNIYFKKLYLENNMLVLLKKHLEFNEGGAYGTIFFHNGTKAVKVFRKTEHSREHIENVFQSEVEAYEIAQSVPAIRELTPIFYGVVTVDLIKTAAGTDISSQFHLDLAYEMEKIDGIFCDEHIAGANAARPIQLLFNSHGIMHTSDMAYLVENSVIKKVVDFATEYHELYHQDIWPELD
jgi:hypothetical protein